MLKKLFIGLMLFPIAVFAEKQLDSQKNTKEKVFINDAVFNCEYFAFDKNAGLGNIKPSEKKGDATVYVENTGSNELFVIATLSDVTSVSTPLLSLQEGNGNESSYGYQSDSDDVYQLVSTPTTGLMMIISASLNKVKVNALISNCSVRYTVIPHGGMDGK
ncbi:hypothetical protein [Providencia manganoxydans]|uniref:hypothetical protein n=1 Tax=Providencia manganoxydans TaxID=2923283 RepID=UPI0034E42C8B